MIFWRFLPEHLKLDLTQTKAITQRELFTSISGDYIGGILAETSTRLLPLLVLFFLGKESTAYFNQAWVVATPFYLVATNMSSSFVVEASANMRQIGIHSRRILRQMLIFLVPAVGLMWLTAPILLSAFGKNYAQGGFQLLRWLILTTLPFMFNAWFLSYARVLGKAKTIILVQATQLVITLGICYVALPRYGINSVGIAWLSSQCVIFIVALFKSIPVLWSNIAQDVKNTNVTRNQLFRRVDWRFLLGKSQVERSICFTNGLLAQSVAAISKQSLDSTSNVTGECDLAAAINPDSATLYAAREALHTEGSLYVEWSPLLAGGVRSIRRRLQNAGFSHIRWYVPLPNPVRPLFWIPLDSSKAAFQYIARRLFPGDQLVQRFMRSIVINALGALMRAGLVPYLSTIANKGTEPFTDIFDEIRFAWQRIYPETQAEQLSFLIKTGGIQLYSKIIWLVFAKSDSEGPDWIVKVPRFHEDAGSLQHEKLILSDLGSALQEKNSVLKIPVTLCNLKRNEVELYVQTGLRGEPLTQIISEDRFQEIALRLTKTQIALAESTKSWTGTVTSQELVDQMLNKLVLFVGSLPAFQHLLQSQQILKNFDAVPLVCTHNDFTPWNIIQESDSLGIFDWSDAEQRGLPMLDLIYGLSTLAFTMDRTHNGEDMRVSYQKLLDPKKRRGAIFGECLSFYAASLGIPPQQIAYLRLLTWMRHSFNELDNHKVEMADSTRPFQSICASIWNLELEYQQSAQIERSARGKQDQNG
ncbi:MAG TPA: phosphotransferase [Anaerolineales bacterium]|nr:phosphotransferase [Anaerolineales bacterium]